jgi:hypothetical protein
LSPRGLNNVRFDDEKDDEELEEELAEELEEEAPRFEMATGGIGSGGTKASGEASASNVAASLPSAMAASTSSQLKSSRPLCRRLRALSAAQTKSSIRCLQVRAR